MNIILSYAFSKSSYYSGVRSKLQLGPWVSFLTVINNDSTSLSFNAIKRQVASLYSIGYGPSHITGKNNTLIGLLTGLIGNLPYDQAGFFFYLKQQQQKIFGSHVLLSEDE